MCQRFIHETFACACIRPSSPLGQAHDRNQSTEGSGIRPAGNLVFILEMLYTRYPIVARALGLAFRPSARASKGILHTTGNGARF